MNRFSKEGFGIVLVFLFVLGLTLLLTLAFIFFVPFSRTKPAPFVSNQPVEVSERSNSPSPRKAVVSFTPPEVQNSLSQGKIAIVLNRDLYVFSGNSLKQLTTTKNVGYITKRNQPNKIAFLEEKDFLIKDDYTRSLGVAINGIDLTSGKITPLVSAPYNEAKIKEGDSDNILRWFSFSSEGKRIAYTLNGARIRNLTTNEDILITADINPPQKDAIRSKHYMQAQWSPNDQYILLTASGWEWTYKDLYDVNSKTTKDLSRELGSMQTLWSKDNSMIMGSNGAGFDSAHIVAYFVNSRKTSTNLGDGGINITSEATLFDNSFIAIISPYATPTIPPVVEGCGLYKATFSPDTLTLLTRFSTTLQSSLCSTAQALSPDGKQLAFIAPRENTESPVYDLKIVNTDGTNPQTLISNFAISDDQSRNLYLEWIE